MARIVTVRKRVKGERGRREKWVSRQKSERKAGGEKFTCEKNKFVLNFHVSTFMSHSWKNLTIYQQIFLTSISTRRQSVNLMCAFVWLPRLSRKACEEDCE